MSKRSDVERSAVICSSSRALTSGPGGSTWTIVSPALAPDPTALALVEQDITDPWTENTVKTFAAKLTSKAPTKTFVVATPLDGTIVVKPRQSSARKVTVTLLGNNRSVKSRTFNGTTAAAFGSTVCGLRKYTLRAKLTGKLTESTKTTVSLTVSTP